jgi:hypothetical protein
MEPEELLGNSEYDNAVALLGINMEGDVFGQIIRLPKEKQAPAIKAVIATSKKPQISSGEKNSRQEFERRFIELPKEIRDGLLNKRLQLADTRFYVVKDISTKTMIDQLQGVDQKNVGLGNLASQKIEKDNWFILSALRLQYAVNPDKETAAFGPLPASIINGEFELEAGNKKLVGLISCEVFDTQNMTNIQANTYKLHSPKMIEPQVEIKMPIKFTAAAPAQAWLKLVMIGTSVIPY